MDLSGLITFWALTITAYSVLPEYWKFKVVAFIDHTYTILAFIVSSALIFWSMLINNMGYTIAMYRLSMTILPIHLQIAAYSVCSL